MIERSSSPTQEEVVPEERLAARVQEARNGNYTLIYTARLKSDVVQTQLREQYRILSDSHVLDLKGEGPNFELKKAKWIDGQMEKLNRRIEEAERITHIARNKSWKKSHYNPLTGKVKIGTKRISKKLSIPGASMVEAHENGHRIRMGSPFSNTSPTIGKKARAGFGTLRSVRDSVFHTIDSGLLFIMLSIP